VVYSNNAEEWREISSVLQSKVTYQAVAEKTVTAITVKRVTARLSVHVIAYVSYCTSVCLMTRVHIIACVSQCSSSIHDAQFPEHWIALQVLAVHNEL
jgi:hypothetical protein